MNVIMKWEDPEYEIVVCRSFSIFKQFLSCFKLPAVQLYAAWAINHLCSKNCKIYFVYKPRNL